MIDIEVIPPQPGTIRRFFDRIKVALGLRRPQLALLQDAAREFDREIKAGFDAGKDPYGVRWKPSVANKLCGQRTLIKTGRLRNSTTAQARGTRIVLKSTAPYAKTHQQGAVIRAKNKPYLRFQICGRWFSKKQVTIPKRLILPVDGGTLPRKWEGLMQRALDRRAARVRTI